MMTPISVFTILCPAAAFAAAASVFTQTPTATSLVPTLAGSTQSLAALTTPGPPIIVLDTPADNETLTTLTTTFEDGYVVTGKFELATLTEYSNLRQQLTITSTTTYNGTDGSVEVALAAGIVMAGGTIVGCFFQ